MFAENIVSPPNPREAVFFSIEKNHRNMLFVKGWPNVCTQLDIYIVVYMFIYLYIFVILALVQL